jgi:serine protease Do
MFKKLKITRRYRVLALAGAAVVAAPLLAYPVVQSPAAFAEAQSDTATTERPVIHSDSFADIVAAARPAVVTITTKMEQKVANMPQFGPGSPFDEFFRRFFGENGPVPMPHQGPGERHRVAQALGSGFIVSPDGTIVTNNHVIDGASEIKVTLDDGSEYAAKLVGTDPKTDLAVLKIDADKKLPTLEWGNSDTLRAGDQVLAIGNPFGVGTTVTSGIVSARGRDLHSGPYDDFIQVDAAINHGNSGGPLVDTTGKVVGINTAIYSPNGGNVGVGFAIPSDQAQKVVQELIKNGSIERGYLGVAIQPVNKDIAEALGLDDAEGALVANVQDGTPAAKAGVEAGDVVTKFDGKDVESPKDLSRMVANAEPGDKADLTVWRNDKSIELSVTLANMKDAADNDDDSSDNGQSQSQSESGFTLPDLGLELGKLNEDERQAYSIPDDVNGVVIEDVDPDKTAGDHGLQEGDVILSVNQVEVKSPDDVKKQVEEAKKDGRESVLLQVSRGDSKSFVALTFDNG